MASIPLRRGVLVLTDDVSIRNLFYLMRRLADENAAEGSARAMAAIAEREQYDAVILDMRCPEGKRGGEVHGIGKVQSCRLDRMLTITAEVSGPETVTLVERYVLGGLPGALAWLVAHPHAPGQQLQPY
jgi:DNA-binding NtrC family response regulator